MDGHPDRLPQIFRMVATISVVVIPPLLNLCQKFRIVKQGKLTAAVETGVILIQITDFVLQTGRLRLFVLCGADHIDFLLR